MWIYPPQIVTIHDNDISSHDPTPNPNPNPYPNTNPNPNINPNQLYLAYFAEQYVHMFIVGDKPIHMDSILLETTFFCRVQGAVLFQSIPYSHKQARQQEGGASGA